MIARPSHRIDGVLWASAASLCWGISNVMSKIALAAVSPILLLALQLAASVSVLWMIVLLRRPAKGSWRDIAKFAWLGLLEPGLAYPLGLIGLTDLEASGAILIQGSEPSMIIVVSAILFRDRPSARFILLSFLAFGGLLMALGILDHADMRGNGPLGILLMLCATATAAIYVVLSSREAARADPIYIVAWQQTVALLFSLASISVQGATQLQSFPSTFGTWVLVGASGIVQYALAFSFYMKALRTVNVNVAGILLNLPPIFGLACAFLFLREEMSLLQLVGALLTVAAVTMITLGDASVRTPRMEQI